MNRDAVEAIIEAQPWGEWRTIRTRQGERRIRVATPGKPFWNAWAEERGMVAALGVSPKKDEAGRWTITQWTMPNGGETPLAAEQRAQEATDRADALAVPDIQINAAGLLPFQGPAVKRLVAALRRFDACLDASSTGVGKTYIALGAAREMGEPVAVITLKPVIPSWVAASRHMGVRPVFVENYEALRCGSTRWCEPLPDKAVFSWARSLKGRHTVIIDEVHNAKGHPPTLNAHLVSTLVDAGHRLILLSATAATGAHEMWALGKALRLHAGTDFRKWMKKVGVVERPHEGPGGPKMISGSKTMLALHRQLFPSRGNRLRHEDIADFPMNQKLVEAWQFASAAEIQAAYEKMERELLRLKEKKDNSPGRDLPVVIMLRARQEIELLKVPEFAAMAQSAVAEGQSVALFVNFDDTAVALERLLRTGCVIRGGQSVDARQALVTAFQSNREPIIICNIQAGGVGISLHDPRTKRPRTALISPGWSAVHLLQACGRCHRAGGGYSTTRIVFAADTVEEITMKAVQGKLERLTELNDGELAVAAPVLDSRQPELSLEGASPPAPRTAESLALV